MTYEQKEILKELKTKQLERQQEALRERRNMQEKDEVEDDIE